MVPGTNADNMVVGPARTVAAVRHGVKKASAKRSPPPYPKRQLLILGMSSFFPGLCVTTGGEYQEHGTTETKTRNNSPMPDMRAHRLHVDFPLRLPHGQGLQHHQ